MRGVVVLAAMMLLTLMSSGCFVAEEDPEAQSASGTATASASGTGTKATTKSGTGSANATATPGENHAPTVNLTATPSNGSAPLNVTFSITGNDTDGDTLRWVLVLGNETLGNGTGLPASHNHTFTQAGNHTVVVRVHDGAANVTANVTVVVGAATGEPAPPTASEDAWVVFNPDGTCDAKGEIGAVVYVHERGNPPGTGFLLGAGTWVYEESNSKSGLQVGGVGEAAEYAGCLNPDTLIF